jgi:hypothetical protein
MPRNRAAKMSSKKNQITNVRVVDESAGTDGLYIDRAISSLQASQQQIRVLCEDSFSLNVATSATFGNLAHSQIKLFDEFVSLFQQYETYRVTAIRFDVYDINPANTVTAWFSTFHDQYTASNQPVFSAPNVIDGPDSLIVPPGLGKATLYWRAKGTQELEFQSADDASTNFITQDYGGLRYAINAGTAGAKFQVLVKALVDFRARL